MARFGKNSKLDEKMVLYRERKTNMSRQNPAYQQRVINQSAENILYYCPTLQQDKVQRSLSLLCGLTKTHNYSADLQKLRELLKEINLGFSEKENIPIHFVSQESERILVNFRR